MASEAHTGDLSGFAVNNEEHWVSALNNAEKAREVALRELSIIAMANSGQMELPYIPDDTIVISHI